ncbi:hypothetical protein M1145_01215 [Patescibacteria group bacterium]|nr:hypothetical protein [Patescibacteria group bacterium]
MIEQDQYNQNEHLSLDQIARDQLDYGEKWADILILNGMKGLEQGTEMALRNPVVYLQETNLEQLPVELHQKWTNLLDLSEAFVQIAGTEKRDWGKSVSGLEKLQNLMQSGSIEPNYQVIIDIIRLSSQLFEQSITKVPGNVDSTYYQGNIEAMKSHISAMLR